MIVIETIPKTYFNQLPVICVKPIIIPEMIEHIYAVKKVNIHFFIQNQILNISSFIIPFSLAIFSIYLSPL